ncbi:MAG: histidine triad nucleotide-binding protein [bacterium]|nr:histidine triad nucleotide-binding protein [bacterium]MDT8395123.1 histidine triad nucleotide-binding protein [bacterium]
MSDCIFCRIVAGDIPAKVAYEDDDILAFEDISPKAPVHILLIPKRHFATLNDPEGSDAPLLGKMMLKAAELAGERRVAEAGYRVLVNTNPQGGQEVFHLHMHLLGGRQMVGMG